MQYQQVISHNRNPKIITLYHSTNGGVEPPYGKFSVMQPHESTRKLFARFVRQHMNARIPAFASSMLRLATFLLTYQWEAESHTVSPSLMVKVWV